MRAVWLCGAFLLASVPAFAQSPGAPDARARALQKICAQVPCRKAATLTLRTAGGSGHIDSDPFPYLDPNGNVVIYAGETITLALAGNGSGKPRLLQAIDAAGTHQFAQAAAGEKTLVFQLQQMDGKPDMILTVVNTTSATIKYDAVMSAVTDKGISQAPTSSCPVNPPIPGQASFRGIESWPFAIVDLLIHDIRPLGKSDSRDCK